MKQSKLRVRRIYEEEEKSQMNDNNDDSNKFF
jgi:hypothetical protein